jgi:phenylacetate-CoA ligase
LVNIIFGENLSSKMISLFDLSLKLNGFPIKEAKAELNRIVNLSTEEHAKFIQDKKREIVDFHLQNNSFYQELVGNKNDYKWEDLPILNKQNLQKPLVERLSKGYTLKNVYLNKTSGSSGTPFVFAKDKYSHALTWASNIMRFGWFNIDFNHSYQARFYGIPMDFIGYQKERFKDFLSGRFSFTVFDFSVEVFVKLLGKFKKQKIDYINC